jgi:CMP-N,N'-diacetyllegionaminic acid synthase
MNNLAFIPARCGSRRVVGKNIKLLAGQPLIAYTIQAALKTKLIDRIVVSTDSPEIAAIAREHGAETPFLRPAEIAQSDSTEMDFFRHALDWFSENEKCSPKLIILLYPTSPFRKPATIDRAIETMLAHPEADSLRSICQCSEHPYKMWRISKGYLKPFLECNPPNTHTFSTQLFPVIYIQNASIYITKPKTILEKNSPTGDTIIPFIMDQFESLDINTPLDFTIAETLISQQGSRSEQE